MAAAAARLPHAPFSPPACRAQGALLSAAAFFLLYAISLRAVRRWAVPPPRPPEAAAPATRARHALLPRAVACALAAAGVALLCQLALRAAIPARYRFGWHNPHHIKSMVVASRLAYSSLHTVEVSLGEQQTRVVSLQGTPPARELSGVH